MIKKDEFLLTVDQWNNPIGPQPRNIVHKNRIWHRAVHIWIINSKKQILCQKRSLLKDMNPGKWECFFGGHLSPNQDYIDCALQELKEELGTVITEEQLRFLFINKNNTHKEFQGVSYLKINEKNPKFIIEKEEIEELKWFDLQKLKLIFSTENKTWSHHGYEQKILQILNLL